MTGKPRRARLVVGEVIEQESTFKRLFAHTYLGCLNRATIDGEVFYWLPHAQDTNMPANSWAEEAVYGRDARIEKMVGWGHSQPIRGPAIIKKMEIMLPCVRVALPSPNDAAMQQIAKDSFGGIWFLSDNPYRKSRHLFAEDPGDLVMGKMLFG